MTNEEAIEYLQESKCDQKQGHEHQEIHDTVLDLAIQALEKQVGKVPLNIDIPEYKYGSKTATCPICGAIIESPLNRCRYCSNCGQKIDWSE